jgi:hypothetical protein
VRAILRFRVILHALRLNAHQKFSPVSQRCGTTRTPHLQMYSHADRVTDLCRLRQFSDITCGYRCEPLFKLVLAPRAVLGDKNQFALKLAAALNEPLATRHHGFVVVTRLLP